MEDCRVSTLRLGEGLVLNQPLRLTARKASTTVGSNWRPALAFIPLTAERWDPPPAVRPVGGDGIVGISHSEHARRQGYLLPPAVVGIAAAIIALVVAEDNLPCPLKEGGVPHHLVAQLRMPLEVLPLIVAEGTLMFLTLAKGLEGM
jgi:hypothetical protein